MRMKVFKELTCNNVSQDADFSIKSFSSVDALSGS